LHKRSTAEIQIVCLPSKTKKTKKMKLLTATLTLALCACSVSKETYTETRTLHYPKGITPHLKDFYLQPGAEQPQPQPTINSTPDYAGVLPDSDVIPTYNTQNIAEEIERLKHENELLEARAYNQALQNL
jgi:hypothetical protein